MRLADTEALQKWELMDLPPLSTWTEGRAALLGGKRLESPRPFYL